MQNVIVRILITGLFVIVVATAARGQDAVERKVDSLFVIASSGSIMFQDMREPAMDSIAALGEAAVPYMIDKFTTRSARKRWTIIWVLQRIGSPAIPFLVEALNRSESVVVQRVCWALGDVGDSTAVEPLIAIVKHEHWQVRDQAISALGKIGDLRAENVVVDAFDDSIGQVRKSASVAAGRMLLDGYEDRLVHMLGDEFYGARMSAVNTLLLLDTATVTTTVTDSIRSADAFVSHLGCYILGQFGTGETLDTLMTLTESPDPDLRAHAAVALILADPEDHCLYREDILLRETDRLVRMKIESAIYSSEHDRK